MRSNAAVVILVLVATHLFCTSPGAAQTIEKAENRFGLRDIDSTWILTAEYDTISQQLNTHIFIFSREGKQGYAILPNLSEHNNDWIVSECNFDKIYIAKSKTQRKPWHHYLVLLSVESYSYIPFVVDYHLTTGIFDSREIKGIQNVFPVSSGYDTLFRATNPEGLSGDLVLKKGDLYGMHVGWNNSTPVEYDHPPKILGRSECIEVQKEGLVGIWYREALAIPIQYTANVLEYSGNDDFEVEENGKAIHYFIPKDGVDIQLSYNGTPLLATQNESYILDPITLFGDTIRVLIGWGNDVPEIDRSQMAKTSREYLLAGHNPRLFIANLNTGQITHFFNNPNCVYSVLVGDRFIAEYKPIGNAKKIAVTIYNIDDGRPLLSYKVKKYVASDDVLYLKTTHNSHYEFQIGPKGGIRDKRKTVGFLDYSTLEFQRKRRK